MKICLIGYGRLAHNLHHALRGKAIVTQIFNRSITRIQKFENEVSISDDYKELEPADLYIICVKDDAIESVSQNLHGHIPTDALVVHTSGSQPASILNQHRHYGFFYPLQTFSFDVQVDFSEIPVYIWSNKYSELSILSDLVEILNANGRQIDEEQKTALHLAAVFANNFSNYMCHIAEEICSIEQLEFEDLLPIIEQTASKLKTIKPALAQTGPALRNDQASIARHLKLLQKYKPEWKDLYEKCSLGINSQLKFEQLD